MSVNPNPATYADLIGNVEAYAGILQTDGILVLDAAKALSDANTKQAADTILSDTASSQLGAAISDLDPKIAVGLCVANPDGTFTAYENAGAGKYTVKTLLSPTMTLPPTANPGPPA